MTRIRWYILNLIPSLLIGPLFAFLFLAAWKPTGRVDGDGLRRKPGLIEDSSSNFAVLCGRKRRLHRQKRKLARLFESEQRRSRRSWLFHVAAGSRLVWRVAGTRWKEGRKRPLSFPLAKLSSLGGFSRQKNREGRTTDGEEDDACSVSREVVRFRERSTRNAKEVTRVGDRSYAFSWIPRCRWIFIRPMAYRRVSYTVWTLSSWILKLETQRLYPLCKNTPNDGSLMKYHTQMRIHCKYYV